MRLSTWLEEALEPFPPGVQRRLAAEYCEHYQDSIEAGGIADASRLFGDPELVQRQLRRVYLTRQSYADLTRFSRQPWTTLFRVLLGVMVVVGSARLTHAWRIGDLPWAVTLATCLAVLGLLFWSAVWSRRWPPIRRRPFRIGVVFPLLGLLIGGLDVLRPVGSPGWSEYAAMTTAFGLMVLVSVGVSIIKDRRLQRTLDAEQAQG